MEYYQVFICLQNIITNGTFMRRTKTSGAIAANKKIRILACMVSSSGKTFKEIIPEKEGRWNPGSIYAAKKIKDVLSVKGKLEEDIIGRE